MYILSNSELRRRLGALLNLMGASPPIVFKADVVIASPNLNNISSTVGLEEGDLLSGPQIAPGTTLLQLGPGPTGLMSLPATATLLQASITSKKVANGQVHLFAAAASPGPEPTPASFTEANFDTYTPLPIGPGSGPFTQPDGSASSEFGDISWVLTVIPVTPNIIFGYWVDYLVNGVRTVAFYESFAGQIPMNDAGNAVVLSIPIKEPPPGSAVVAA